MSDDVIKTVFDPFDIYLQHEGVLRKSGRYPWGSGNEPYQRNKDFLSWVDDLQKKGMSEAEIAKGMGLKESGREFTSSDIRALKSIAKTANREADISRAQQLKDRGLSNIAIGKEMGLNESSVRSLLDPSLKERNDVLRITSELFKERIGDNGIIDVGTGVENHLGIAPSKKAVAIAMLEEQGYKRYWVPVEQLGTGKTTTTMVLAAPGMGFSEVMARKSEIAPVRAYSEDGGRSYKKIAPPQSIHPDRVEVRWGPDGGAHKDGVIELRRGVEDLSLGDSRYAQVRIKVGKDKYLKGMAMYADDLPPGVDMRFNTNKASTGNKLDAMKDIKIDKGTGKQDAELPFGSIVRQREYTDSATGKKKLSPLNIVGDNEEGRWGEWSKTLSSQMLSKQPPTLAKQQLALSFAAKKSEYDDIMALSNPVVKKKLLEEFAEGADSSAKHLKAAGLPRTRSHVILPINSLKDNEVYAPNYRNGEKVVLIRHPHGGTFEIPELTVNNRNREANSVIKNAADAIGINSRVAARLSGADFDGDTVLVIPNDRGSVRTSPALAQLKNFDPQKAYPGYEGMPVMKGKQKQMGDVSNLITDMTIRGASQAELARAVKHSMVVIDAEKHKLNYKQSAKDNGIAELKKKYQGGEKAGAATLVSRSKSTEYVDARKPRSAAKGGPIDPKTGRKVYEPTGETYVVRKENKRTGTITETIEKRKIKSTKMDEAVDANQLLSKNGGTVIERVYADHANKLKTLANSARKEAYGIKPPPVSQSARTVYAEEVKTLKAKLNVAKQNAPRERQAQLLAATNVAAKKQANPDMEKDDYKKVKAQALTEARRRVGAKKEVITFTPREWEAVQNRAVAASVLSAMLNNADMDQVRTLATPRERKVMSDAKIRRAQSMLALGYTQAEIADSLGVPASTLNDAIGK